MTKLSLVFRNGESGSHITLTWENGQVTKDYNGRVAGRRWECRQEPEGAQVFEQWCRRAFMLPSYWRVVSTSGFRQAEAA